MAKTRNALQDDDFYADTDLDDFEYRESQREKRERTRRHTELRRKMEEKLERRRLADELGIYLDDNHKGSDLDSLL